MEKAKAKTKGKSKSNKLTKDFGIVKETVYKYRDMLQSKMWVAIDPSCVSASSEPAFAFFRGTEFISQGTFGIKYKYGMPLWLRLQMIREVVQNEIAPEVELVVIEKTPDVPLFSKKKAGAEGRTYMNPTSIASLKQACGVIKGSFPVGTPVLDMPPGVWQNIVRKAGCIIDKEDPTDARQIGAAVILLLTEIQNGFKQNESENK